MNDAWIEVIVETSLDAGELLGMLNDPHVAGGWQDNADHPPLLVGSAVEC